MAATDNLAAVDVVVVSWNVRDDLRECVRSVLASQHVEARVVVVDNASEDGSADMVAREFSSVTLIRNASNEGFSRALNAGVLTGEAPYVVWLNPDCRLAPGTLARLVAKLESLPGHAAVAPRLVDDDGHPQHSVYRFPSLWISLLLATSAYRLLPRSVRARLLLEGAWQSDEERDVPWAIGAVIATRRATMTAVGLLDESYFVYVEDLDWCDRAQRRGLHIRFDPAIEVTHLGNRSGAQKYGADRTAAYLANTMRFVRRRHGSAWAAAFMAINAAATLGRYATTSIMVRARPTPRRQGQLEMWRAYARFYAGRSSERAG